LEVHGRALCVAEVKQGTGRELARVVVRLASNNVEAACTAARMIVAEVWRTLRVNS
jgi:hypothetical protein